MTRPLAEEDTRRGTLGPAAAAAVRME
jgi:hypothetical protein